MDGARRSRRRRADGRSRLGPDPLRNALRRESLDRRSDRHGGHPQRARATQRAERATRRPSSLSGEALRRLCEARRFALGAASWCDHGAETDRGRPARRSSRTEPGGRRFSSTTRRTQAALRSALLESRDGTGDRMLSPMEEIQRMPARGGQGGVRCLLLAARNASRKSRWNRP